MKPLRLALVTRRFWPHIGQTEQAMMNFAAELRSQGAEPTVVTARWDKSWPSKAGHQQTPIVRLPHTGRGGWATIRYLGQLSRWMRLHRDQFDLVYVASLRHEAYAVMRTLRRFDLPVALRCQRVGALGDCSWQASTKRGAKVKSSCQRANALIATSSVAADELQQAGYSPQRLHTIADGVGPGRSRDHQKKIAARAALADAHQVLAVAEHSPLVVYAGPLRENRHLDSLIAAWPPIAARWPNARLWLVGRGKHEEKLWDSIKQRDLAHQIILTGSFDHLDGVLQAADLFVLPSQHQGDSLSTLEAMASGIAIIAANGQENRELIEDGRQGLLVPEGDTQRLTEAIFRMLDTPQLDARLGAAARLRATEQFSISRMAADHLQLFQRLVAIPLPDCR